MAIRLVHNAPYEDSDLVRETLEGNQLSFQLLIERYEERLFAHVRHYTRNPVEVEDMATCMDANCGDACNDEIVECLITSCFLQFLALAPECNRCVQAHVGTADAAEVLDTCSTGGIEYSYGGSFGTGILSKHPLGSTEEIVLDSTTSRRSLIRTTVEVPKQDPIEVWCTHLTAGLSLIPYPREEGSWEEEQRVQAEQLAALLADAPDPLVVLGDLNTGPDTNDADAEFIDHYQAIMAAGLSAPYVDQDGRCTFCPENAISSVDSDAVGRLIDHVLLRGFEGDTVVDRVFDKDMDIQSCDTDIPGALSDHYGVSVSISP